MKEILFELSETIIKKQIADKNSPNYGAIKCGCCNCFHTRAGEAIFPLALCYKYSKDDKFLESTISLGNWLISQQQAEGFWFETPSTWQATTVFQLMSIAAAYPIFGGHLSSLEREKWHNSIKRAANWICNTISEKIVNINYCASSAAALMLTYQIIKEDKFRIKARKFAKLILKKINKEGFICGEGKYIPLLGRSGVDLGYNLDMSLGALAIYVVLSNEVKMKASVIKSLKAHLNFMYPDGSIDNSWGARSYKWTMYGSKTAHGSQMALGIFLNEDPIFKKAFQLTLKYLKNAINNGLVGYGPHSWWNESFEPCIYPTFNRATGIAFALNYSSMPKGKAALSLKKSEEDINIKFFKSINVCLIKNKNLKATITGYRPFYSRWNYFINIISNLPRRITPRNPFRNKIQTPTGGSLSYLWEKNYGVVQVSSQTKYSPVESIHMPEIDKIETLTPHIRVLKGNSIFTNLYDLNTNIKYKKGKETCNVICMGKLKNEKFDELGLKYQYNYKFDSRAVTKKVVLWVREKLAKIEIIEPIIRKKNMQIKPLDNGIIIKSERSECIFTLLTTNVELIHGQNMEKYWSPFPYLYAYPIKLLIKEVTCYPVIIEFRIEMRKL